MSSPVPKFKIEVRNNGIKAQNKKALSKYLATLEGQECSLVIRKWKEEKTAQQLGYFFGVVVPEALGSEEFGGWTKDEFYGYVKNKFFRKAKQTASGELVAIIEGFSTMTKDEASDKIDEIIMWLSMEHNCYVPKPGEDKLAYQS